MSLTREHLSQEIIEAGRFLYGRGWSPATSSNYSTRLSASEALLTVSGKHKGQLGPDDVLATDLAATAWNWAKSLPPKPCCTPSYTAGARRSVRCCIPIRSMPRYCRV